MKTLIFKPENRNYKFLSIIVMLYITIKITTVMMIYKITSLFGYTVSVSALIIPLWFFLGDIITEVYGYKLAKKIIWYAITCQIIFSLLCASLAALPSVQNWPNQADLNQVMLTLPRVALSSSVAIIAGAFINAYALSKWNILLHGKYFGLRSLGATAIGELVFTIFSYGGEFFGLISLDTVIRLVMLSYVTKLVINLLLVLPAAIICYILKNLEGSKITNEPIDISRLNFDVGG